MANNQGDPAAALDPTALRSAVQAACGWIQDVAQLKTDQLPADTTDRQGFGYTRWRGAIRGEYSAAQQAWWFFCPVWHTGQAVKALVLASQQLDEPKWFEGAQAGADFLLNQQVWDPQDPNHGLLLAFEDIHDQVNTSAVFEALDGLMLLADALGSEAMWERIVAAGAFMVEKTFMPQEGLFRDLYIPAEHRIGSTTRFLTKAGIGGRPLLDDGVLLKLYDRTGDTRFERAYWQVAERLVADQNPPGNWIDYGPCNPERGLFHPRHTYWWGLPLIEAFRRSGRRAFLETALASGEFCLKAMRADGGYIRGTYLGFNTDSFGHATSGSACAALLFLELFAETGERRWFDAATRALDFCSKVQLCQTADPNLKGAILEKVLPPDGTDRHPYYLRDLGTIFFVTAAARYLAVLEKQTV